MNGSRVEETREGGGYCAVQKFTPTQLVWLLSSFVLAGNDQETLWLIFAYIKKQYSDICRIWMVSKKNLIECSRV